MKSHGVQLLEKRELFALKILHIGEMKEILSCVYVNGKKLFTIDSGVDDSEFMEDIERRRIPVKSYWANQHKKNRK